jgi:predicted  nucleic acid-binding Zn-ribbon protein
MTDRKRNPEEILEDMLNKHVLFEKLEIGSGLLAGAGTIALGVMKEAAVFAAAPLTIAIALNYFNRVRMGQIGRYQTHVEVAEVQRRLSSEIQGLRGQSFEGSASLELADAGQIQNAVASLSETVAALEAQVQQGSNVGGGDTSHFQEELLQLRNHQLDLSQSLEAVNQHLRGLSGTETSAIDYSIEIAALREQVAQLQSSPMPVGEGASIDLEGIRTEFHDLLMPVRDRIGDLESRFTATASPEGTAAPSSEDLQVMQGQMYDLNQKLEQIASQLSAELAGFQHSVEKTQDQVNTIQQQVQTAQQEVAAVPMGANTEAIHQEMQAVVGPLHEQIAALEQKLGSIHSVDPQVSQLQAEQMISLQNQLNSTNGLIEEVTAQLSNQITAELSKIPQLVDAQIEQKVSTLQPAPVSDKKQDALSELDSILADINL